MKSIKQSYKGITLVALVITIIILLILSTISIQVLTNTGLFKNANQSKLENKRSQIKEWLSLNLMEVQSANYDKTDSEILEIARDKAEKSEELKKLGKTVNVDGEISTEEDGQTVPQYFDVIVDNDMYKVSMEEQEFIGEVGKIVPSVDFSATITSKSITLKITTKRSQGGTVECYIKGENDSNYETAQKATDNQYTFDNLEQGKKYKIKVVVTSGNGQKAEKEKEYITEDVKELTAADVEFEYSVDGTVINKNTWTNKEVKITAKPKVDITGYTLVTKKNDGTWQKTDNQTFNENGTMYVALTDGKNYGDTEATGNVTNIDKIVPEITNITSTVKSIIISAKDEKSGIVGIKITTTNEIPTKFEDITKTENLNNKEITGLNEGTTYFIWIKDAAGNISETKSIQTKQKFTITYNANGGNGAPNNQSKIQGENVTLSEIKPTRTGYTFKGWGTSSNTTTVEYLAGATYTVDANLNLYAIWVANEIILYQDRKTSTEIGSGFTQINNYAGTYPSGTFTYGNPMKIKRSTSSGQWSRTVIASNSMIDVTEYSNLYIMCSNVTLTSSNSSTYPSVTSFVMGVTSSTECISTDGFKQWAAKTTISTPETYNSTYNKTNITYKVDISNISGKKYIGFEDVGAMWYGQTSDISIIKIWMD